MSNSPSLSEMQALLRGVSRSFYLSIRLLPVPLRRPIAVAYLLARATDTLADASGLPVAERAGHLAALSMAIDGKDAQRKIASLRTALPPGHDPHEQRLIASLPQCMAWLHTLAPADREDIRTVLRHITQGQTLDLERFAGGETQSLDNAAQLQQYTYLVAGSVGEFWTDLCFRHLRHFSALSQPQMRELGRGYGGALQLINILRDCGNDLADGRCYFPADELAAAGLGPMDIAHQPQRFEPVWLHWQEQAARGLRDGMRYTGAVNSRRVRAASALPALLGARTLALLREAGPERIARKVKVPRVEVRALLARMALTLAGQAPLQAQFDRLSRAGTSRGWDNPAP